MAPAILAGALVAFVNAIALFGSQAIIGLPGRIFTLPTRIYALFDHPPQYGLASALSLIFVAITVVALALQRRYLARRSYVTLGGKGNRPQVVAARPGPLGRARRSASGSSWWPCSRRTSRCWPCRVSRSWGLDFWQNLTLQHYRFILFEYDVTRRAIVNSLVLGRGGRDADRAPRQPDRLGRPPDAAARPEAARLRVAGARSGCRASWSRWR